MSRRISQISTAVDGKVYAVCADGTLWRLDPRESGVLMWTHITGPPEGTGGREPMSLQEQAETIAKKGGRAMIIGRGLKKP